jgi:hypothetical protein
MNINMNMNTTIKKKTKMKIKLSVEINMNMKMETTLKTDMDMDTDWQNKDIDMDMNRMLTLVMDMDHGLEHRCWRLQDMNLDYEHEHGLGHEKIFFFMQTEFPCSAASQFPLTIYSGGQVTFLKLRSYFTSVTGERNWLLLIHYSTRVRRHFRFEAK